MIFLFNSFLDAIASLELGYESNWVSKKETLSQFSICNHCNMLSYLLDVWSCLHSKSRKIILLGTVFYHLSGIEFCLCFYDCLVLVYKFIVLMFQEKYL